jgi:hypothetical protein
MPRSSAKKPAGPLPASVRRFFWDYDRFQITWKHDRDLIIARVLAVGDWGAIIGYGAVLEMRNYAPGCFNVGVRSSAHGNCVSGS